MEYIHVEYVVSVVVAILASNGFWQYMIQRYSKKDVKHKAILALLHDRLYYLCEKHIAENYIPVEDLENINYLYEPYTEMGGNGTVEMLYEKVKKLPHFKEDKREEI